MNNKEREFSFSGIVTAGVIALLVAVIIILTAAFFYLEFSGFNVGTEPAAYLGTLGDFIGGMLNPVAAVLSVGLLAYTLYQNSMALKMSREELQLTRKEMERQADAAKSQALSYESMLTVEVRRSDYSNLLEVYSFSSGILDRMMDNPSMFLYNDRKSFNRIENICKGCSFINVPISTIEEYFIFFSDASDALSSMFFAYKHYSERYGHNGIQIQALKLKSIAKSLIYVIQRIKFCKYKQNDLGEPIPEPVEDAALISIDGNRSLESLAYFFQNVVDESSEWLNQASAEKFKVRSADKIDAQP